MPQRKQKLRLASFDFPACPPAEAEEQLLNAKLVLRAYSETVARRDPEKSASKAVAAAGARSFPVPLPAPARPPIVPLGCLHCTARECGLLAARDVLKWDD